MKETRQAGVLMPVASLPSPYGVGDLGNAAYEFAEILREMGASIWQILPLNPLGYGNSPYQPYSSLAGDPLYISLDKLWEDGFLSEKPVASGKNDPVIDYEKARERKEPYLRQAFAGFLPDESYEEFASQDWVFLYGVFMALKKKNHGICWVEWEEEDRNWILDQHGEFSPELEEEIQYQMFLQYLFFCQWMELKSYVNRLGIRIMGDLPFYVGLDSLDVWANSANFLLDENFRPTYIAGVPPDYFSPTGQRWGNPIYNWEYLRQTDYRFWTDRIGYNRTLFDIVRIDHFRAFDTFWKIPADCPTAMDGEWVEAPGYEVFDQLLKLYPDIEIVIEDLGMLRPQVGKLRDHYHFKGMKIYQFSLDPEEENNDFPDREHMILYTGTHDNQPIKGWYLDQNEKERKRIDRLLEEKRCTEKKIAHRFADAVMQSIAQLSVITVQDILDLGNEGRINTPGTVGSPNWEWRITSLEDLRKEVKTIREIFEKTGRVGNLS